LRAPRAFAIVRRLFDGGMLRLNVSVVVRSKDEAPRLRLTLTSLSAQDAYEVIVVDDGSSDETAQVIAEAARSLPLIGLRHERARGRSAAANVGAAAARGDVLLFLDGDTLAGPHLVARHSEAHRSESRLIGRGETWNLRCTRFLRDPETAAPRAGEEARLSRLPADERERLKVTRRQILSDFDAIARRAAPGVYPGAGPRRLSELEIEALTLHPQCSVLWAAACGHNLSVSRRTFEQVGGFAEELDNNEHRELALRLTRRGGQMGFVANARTYHLTHSVGWRDPLASAAWEEAFLARHPMTEVKLLTVLWASLAQPSVVPPAARLNSLPDLEAAANGAKPIDYENARRLIAAAYRGVGADIDEQAQRALA
jgi:GT2 family glycosyltransferase